MICHSISMNALLLPGFGGTPYPVMSFENDFLRLVPLSTLLRTLQIRTILTVKVLKNAILVPESTVLFLWRRVLDSSHVS